MNIANLPLKTPDWLQVNLAVQLRRSWAIYNKKAVISHFQQEERFWVVIAYIHCVFLGQLGLTAFPASACNFCVSRKAAWFTGRTSSYWGRAWTLVFSCLIFPLACHGIFCKLIACSSLYYSMQECPWKVSSFKLIMWSFFVSWHSLLITVSQFSSTLKQV